ncbi:hypothetical protein NQ315_015822 [Exocentrus adspersus]|uniref:Uncharacterized protein n=1 Tax=Exocentrus adspersus TaxID=1586481 RepID=A0AAV8W4Y8_9CUCU|nr:hypothetical protein NQ315_015822 [Exocentrus adspersus]
MTWCALIFAATTVIHRVTGDVSSFYGYPSPPVQFDEPSTPSNAYLPPIYQDEILPPLPPVPPAPPVPTYLPPVYYPPIGTPPPGNLDDDDTVVVQPPSTPGTLYQTPAPQMKILNMSCVLDASFRSSFRVERKGGGAPPVLDNGAEGCLHSDSTHTYFMDMEGRRKLADCGVKRCTSGTSTRVNMCVTVRMPTVRGIRLPEDGLVTLQCVPHDAVVSHTKHINLTPTGSGRGRSAGAGAVVASGGGQKNFDSRLVLLRKSKSGNFDQQLQPGSVVLLGEELVLRAVVQDGDGWKSSRIGPVVVRSPTTHRSVTLVEETGCRSPGMRSICPHQPRQLSPLDTLLHFRAFLFQGGSPKGGGYAAQRQDVGLYPPPGLLPGKTGACGESNLLPPLRFKRGVGDGPGNGTGDWESQFQFRVQIPGKENNAVSVSGEFLVIVSMLGLCLVVLVGLFIVYCHNVVTKLFYYKKQEEP